jgi:hypothetical protein
MQELLREYEAQQPLFKVLLNELTIFQAHIRLAVEQGLPLTLRAPVTRYDPKQSATNIKGPVDLSVLLQRHSGGRGGAGGEQYSGAWSSERGLGPTPRRLPQSARRRSRTAYSGHSGGHSGLSMQRRDQLGWGDPGSTPLDRGAAAELFQEIERPSSLSEQLDSLDLELTFLDKSVEHSYRLQKLSASNAAGEAGGAAGESGTGGGKVAFVKGSLQWRIEQERKKREQLATVGVSVCVCWCMCVCVCVCVCV